MKNIYFALLFAAFAGTISAQEFYFRAGAGYAVPQAGQTLDGTGSPYNGTLNNNAYSIKNASFSSGAQGYIGAGYMFSEHIGAQLDANFGLRNTKYTFSAGNVSVGGVPSNVNVVQQAKSLAILMPSVVLQTGRGAATFYARTGIALPLFTKITQDQIITNLPGSGAVTTDDFTLQLTNSFALGFTGAAGVKYKISDNISIWGELSFLSMSLYLKEADLTGASENGQNVPLSQITGGSQVVRYSKNALVDSTGANQPTYSLPFSNFGVNIGINISLSNGGGTNSGRGEDGDIERSRRGRFH